MPKDVILTPEGLENLKAELEELSTTRRAEVAERIKAARDGAGANCGHAGSGAGRTRARSPRASSTASVRCSASPSPLPSPRRSTYQG